MRQSCGSRNHNSSSEGRGGTSSSALPLDCIRRGSEGSSTIGQIDFRLAVGCTQVRNHAQEIACSRLDSSAVRNGDLSGHRVDTDTALDSGSGIVINGRIGRNQWAQNIVRQGRGHIAGAITLRIGSYSALGQNIGHILLGGAGLHQTFGNACALCVILISGQSHSSQNTDDRHNDHQFDQGKTLLNGTLHFKLPSWMRPKVSSKLHANNLAKAGHIQDDTFGNIQASLSNNFDNPIAIGDKFVRRLTPVKAASHSTTNRMELPASSTVSPLSRGTDSGPTT